MFFWCVLMCKLSCGCVLLCKVSRSYFANGTLPLYASMHAILVFCFCNFRILFVCTRPCFCVFCVCAFIFLCLCICLCFLYVRVSAPFVNVMTKTIFFISRHKAGKMFVQGHCIYSCNFGLSYRPNIWHHRSSKLLRLLKAKWWHVDCAKYDVTRRVLTKITKSVHTVLIIVTNILNKNFRLHLVVIETLYVKTKIYNQTVKLQGCNWQRLPAICDGGIYK